LTCEAGAAVLRVAPEKFWDFSAALFKQQTEFFDARVANEGRNKTYERLAKIAGQSGVNESQVLELLKISENPQDEANAHVGNAVTPDVKRMVKVSGLL
jgi:protein-disulfide isomerase